MSLGEVEEHCRIATCGNDPPGRGIKLEPVLFEILLPRDALHSILSIYDVVCSTVGIEHGWRGSQLLEAASGFLATRAIAGGGQNRPADCLQSHLAASAYLGEVFLLFLVHCDRPFVGPVYEVISYFGVSERCPQRVKSAVLSFGRLLPAAPINRHSRGRRHVSNVPTSDMSLHRTT